jgi:hypothetical protein
MIVCRNTDLLNMGLVDCIKCLTIASVIRVSFMGVKDILKQVLYNVMVRSCKIMYV